MINNTFKEIVNFNDKVVFSLMGLGFVGVLIGLLKSLFVSSFTMSYLLTYLGLALFICGVFWWLKQLKFTVLVDEDGIKYKMKPIHKKIQQISWNEINSMEVIKTPLAAQWHGSNLRFSNINWFSLSGRNGLSITTKDGRNFFIGCRNIKGLLTALNQYSFKD